MTKKPSRSSKKSPDNTKKKDTIEEWAIELLRWVAHQRQRGCSIVALNEQAHIYETLNFPFLIHLDRYAANASLVDYPFVLGEEIKRLIEEGRVDEAEEAIQVMKILSQTIPPSPAKGTNQTTSVASRMNLEAAKILAEEGDPGAAVTLVEQTRQEDSPTQLKKPKPKRDENSS